MIDISPKIESLRSAVAETSVMASDASLDRVMAGQTPKGEVLTVARVAAMLGAKKVPELIPYCHPLSLDQLRVDFEREPGRLKIRTEVKTLGKTGVEMEALTAVQMAALTVYDMMKGFDKAVVLGETRLLEKRGGKSDREEIFPRPKRAAVLVASDSVAAGKKTDKSGRAIQEFLKDFPVEVLEYQVLPDDPESLKRQILEWVEQGMELIVTTGGTGLGPRDNTAEMLQGLLDYEIPGIAEAMRSYGQRRTPYAMLSRSTAGVLGQTLVLALPGSSRGVAESLQAIFPSVLHAFNMMGGKGH